MKQLIVLSVIVFAFSCKNKVQVEPEPFLVVNSPATLIFDAEGGERKIDVVSNVQWVLSNQYHWISASPMFGKGDESTEALTITLPENTGAHRSGKLTIRAKDQEKEVEVIQYSKTLSFGQPTLTGLFRTNTALSDVSLTIPYSGGIGNESFTISVTPTGEASQGIQPIVDRQFKLMESAGNLVVPISGTPVAGGTVTFVVTTDFADTKTGEVLTIPDVAAMVEETLQATNTVFVIFKTHLDVGFTKLSSVVEAQYMQNDIPAALNTIDAMKLLGNDRFIWTTGTWILSQYLDSPTTTPTQRTRLENAIKNGDVAWMAMPYTVESELASRELFEGMLKTSQKLDEKYNKQTLGAKMSDVPGHTRGIVSPLHQAGVRLLHIGMNRSTNTPQIPENSAYPGICRWRHPDGSSIFLLQKVAYGHEFDLPDGNVLSINVKGDNAGPHTLTQVRNIFSDLRNKYPGKKVIASNLNDVARLLMGYENMFPVFTGEIGDTWIHGMGSAPDRMAKARALYRLHQQWIASGQLDPDSDEAARFALRLGLITEHTWGLDCGTYLQNETPNKYNVDGFQASRNEPAFLLMEESWREIDDYIPQAIALLPAALQQEAQNAMNDAAYIPEYQITGNTPTNDITSEGALQMNIGGNLVTAGLFTLQTMNFTDFRAWTASMMSSTSAKAGMNGSEAVSASVNPVVKALDVTQQNGTQKIRCELQMTSNAINNRLYPEKLFAEYDIAPDGQSIDFVFTMVNKPANRMAELYWLSFVPQNVTRIIVEKMGHPVDVAEVIEGGNYRLIAVDRYVDMLTPQGTFRVTSFDVPLVLVGDRSNMSYRLKPDVSKGIHFNLFNNLWGVNYTMWWEGSQRFRFRIEKI